MTTSATSEDLKISLTSANSTVGDCDKYDYIIAGMGCAGLSLAVRMIESGHFSDKKILLIDKDKKENNDRTWCFWENKKGLFEDLVYAQWEDVWFHAKGFSKLLKLQPYRYKMIRGIDFYTHCLAIIKKHPNFTIQYGNIDSLSGENDDTFAIVDGKKIKAGYIFNSILFKQPVLAEKEYYLLQHFKGWVINVKDPVFDPAKATLMDFRVSQYNGTTFVYVMPFSPTRALVEYTLFTKELLQKEEYDQGLKNYISQYITESYYTIEEEEFGMIPMTNHRFKKSSGNIINLGTAGGQTKASSGYTFQFIQKQTAMIVEALVKKMSLNSITVSAKRFHFYDSVLLNLLHNNTLPCDEIFADLFKKNKSDKVLKFLENETDFSEEPAILLSLPFWPFLKAALKQL